MKPHEQTRVAQMVDRYESKIRELEEKIDTISEMCEQLFFDSTTCPEAYLQQEIKKIKGVCAAKACYKIIDSEIPKLETYLSKSVPFEVLKKNCDKKTRAEFGNYCSHKNNSWHPCTADNCPLIPKVKADE